MELRGLNGLSLPLTMEWAATQGIALSHIQPGKPQQNAYVERYNRTVRHEWLDQYIIESIEEAQDSVRQVGVNSGVEPGRHDQAAFGVI